MAYQVVKVKREALTPCMTCPLCDKLFHDATTIIECLHTFCRKCIYKKLLDDEMDTCPVCNIYLGCVPLEKLRPDHSLQYIKAKTFPSKSSKVKAPEMVTPITITVPVKRKERSLSSLVVSAPRVSLKSGMRGRKSKPIARRTPKSSSYTIEKPCKKEGGATESSSSPLKTLNKYTRHVRHKSTAIGPSDDPSPDKGKQNSSWTSKLKVDPWKPLSFLVEAANRSKSIKFGIQESVDKAEALYSGDNEGLLDKTKNKEKGKKFYIEKSGSEDAPPDSEHHKKLRRVHKKTHNFGEFRIPPQVVVNAASAKHDLINYPIWFSLVASGEVDGSPPLPQISANYIRIKDGKMPVSFIQKYLKAKLDLTSEQEVEIKCMGQKVNPTLTLNNLVDMWLQTTTTERVSATIGSSAKEFVMILGYARRVPRS